MIIKLLLVFILFCFFVFLIMDEKECFENNFVFRKLNEKDYSDDYFKLLLQLTDSKVMNENEFKNILNEINKNGNIFVIEDKGKIIATAKLLIEHKLIRGGSKVGHLEDVVVDKNYRQYGLGKKLVNKIVEIARERGCYKIIGNCDNSLIGFYEKLGFLNKGSQFAIYF